MQRLYEIIHDNPAMKPVLIENLLRVGEVCNLISSSKAHKTFCVHDLAIACAAGGKWLDTYQVAQGNVLVVDAELHPTTFAQRIPLIANARGLSIHEVEERIYVECLRGRESDAINIFELRNILHSACSQEGRGRGFFSLLILDPLYRLWPKRPTSGSGAGSWQTNFDENNNAHMSAAFAELDHLACEFGCAIVLTHHTAKNGGQGRSVVDVGSGASAQARAADTHLVIRQHMEQDVVVVDAAARSFAPITPMCFKWDFPVFRPVPDLDPAQLYVNTWQFGYGPRKKKVKPPKLTPRENVARLVSIWTPEDTMPLSQDEIFMRADAIGMSERVTRRTLRYGEKLHTFTRKKNRKPSEPASFKLGDIVTNENVAK
jgi:hypothetical protein